jgi:hypothetical protein
MQAAATTSDCDSRCCRLIKEHNHSQAHEMQCPQASGNPPMAKPNGNPKGKEGYWEGHLTADSAPHLPMSRCTAHSRGSSSHLVAGNARQLHRKDTGCPMTSSDAGSFRSILFQCQHHTDHRDDPSPNKRGLHCLSVLLTDRMDAASVHDATNLSDRTRTESDGGRN